MPTLSDQPDKRPTPLPRNVWRSGWNKEWTSSLDLLIGPSGRKERKEFFREVGNHPVARCQESNCHYPAEFYMGFHNCYDVLLCYEHLQRIESDVRKSLRRDGGINCPECRIVFMSQANAMFWRCI